MPIADKVLTYSIHINQNNFDDDHRLLRLRLESGGLADVRFAKERPTDWLQFQGASTTVHMTADQFADVYHLVQTENPVFFTALNLQGLMVGAVHSELNLAEGEEPGEGDKDPQSLEALIRRARRLALA